MAFIVQCPYCKVRSRAPERALGASGQCTRCANAFTMVPADDQRAPATSHDDVEPVATAAVAMAITEAVAATPPVVAAAPKVMLQKATSRDRVAAILGTAALLSSGMALICATLSRAGIVVLPMSSIGLAVGLLATGLVCRSARVRLLLPICGSIACASMLSIAWWQPGWLGTNYQAYRHRADVAAAPAALVAIPLGPDWHWLPNVTERVDARTHALQYGDLRVQVIDVVSGPAADDLVIRLRVQRTTKFDGKANRPPTLTDPGGATFALRHIAATTPMDDKKPVNIDTIRHTVLTFAAPPAGWQALHLEVPAEAWGYPGTLSFALPASMVKVKAS